MNVQKSIDVLIAQKGYKSQKEFCEKNDVSPSLVSRVKKGSSDTKLGSIKKIAEKLEVTMSEFFAAGEDK